jgi:hypothetical protein
MLIGFRHISGRGFILPCVRCRNELWFLIALYCLRSRFLRTPGIGKVIDAGFFYLLELGTV